MEILLVLISMKVILVLGLGSGSEVKVLQVLVVQDLGSITLEPFCETWYFPKVGGLNM